MRARNIKPGFFTCPELLELPFEARLLFAGLWCYADREGRLEDRPAKIKLQVLPGDNVDVDALLNQLADKDLVVRYQAEGQRFIQVANFNKHQSPHINEKDSTIQAPCKQGATPSDSLIPDSLIPDSHDSPIPDTGDSWKHPEVEEAVKNGDGRNVNTKRR